MNYLFMCMKRSGQHGVVNWFAQQNHHDVLHLNNCINGWKERHLSPMKEHMVVHYKYNGATHDVKNYFIDHKIDLSASKRLRGEYHAADFGKVKERLYNIEDLSLSEYTHLQMWNFAEMGENSRTILILRDPFNFIASCLQRLKDPPDAGATDVGVQLPQRLKVWKEHARQVLYQSESDQDIYFINFNEWFQSHDYRRKICSDLGLVHTDAGVNQVMNFGNGSSFDREKFNGSAQEMSVLTRYKSWEHHPAFKHLVDDELRSWGKEIFGVKIKK